MGGPGSGNFYHSWRPKTKTTVEACRMLDAARWLRDGILEIAVHEGGIWRWKRGGIFDVTYTVNTEDMACPFVWLEYAWSDGAGNEPRSEREQVLLPTTEARIGGLRWWFLCPAPDCGRRVRKLYVPPGGS